MLGLGNSITSVSPKVETAMTSAIQYNFDGATDQTFAGDPHGFTKATNSMAAFSGGGSLVAYHGMGSNANTHGWVNGAAATGSSATGPIRGHGGGFDTLGETVVIFTAGLGVIALLTGNTLNRKTKFKKKLKK